MAFISSNYKPVFTSEAMPRLVTLYRAETPYTSMPRTMHRHDDVAEFILITGGSGIHIIDGQRYYTQKGDLLLIGQDVVHDESSPANRNLSIYSGAIRGLQLPDLPAGKFLPPNVLPVLKKSSSRISVICSSSCTAVRRARAAIPKRASTTCSVLCCS